MYNVCHANLLTQLTPLSDNEWSTLLEKELSIFVKDTSRINDSCRFRDLPE